MPLKFAPYQHQTDAFARLSGPTMRSTLVATGTGSGKTESSLSVLGAMYRWLMQQRYVLANPFAGIKVRGAARVSSLPASRVFAEGEWSMIQTVAEGLEWSYGWEPVHLP